MLLVLKGTWPGVFRRTVRVRDGVGQVVSEARYEFAPGKPQEVAAEHVELLVPDIGAALHYCYVDGQGHVKIVDAPGEIPAAFLTAPPDPEHDKTQMPTLKTLKEVAEYFEIDEAAVKQWRAAGMPGASGAWDTAAIQAWLDEQPDAQD